VKGSEWGSQNGTMKKLPKIHVTQLNKHQNPEDGGAKLNKRRVKIRGEKKINRLINNTLRKRA